MKQPSQANRLLVCLLFYIPVVWAALLIAQSLESSQGPAGGLPALIASLTAALQNPLEVRWTDKSLLSILSCTGVYIMALALWGAEHGRRREGAEHGSAAWASPRQVNAMFAQKENKILTRNVRLGLDTHKHRRSLNVLVIGGSGAAKTRSYVKPNILEANTNYVVTDSKQEVLTATGGWLKQNGYEIRVLNLVNLEQSDGYNPFRYLRDEKDALKLVNNLIQATTPKGSHESDPFWTKAETALLQAIILMLFQEAPEYEQNFSMVMRVLEYAEVKEEDEEYISPLDLLFQAIEQDRPDSVAVRQYKVFKMAAGKTSKSILVSTAVRLAPFNLPQIKAITDHDDMDLYTLGEKKCALYAVIPDNDTSFNFLVSLLYAQAFQALYYSADQIHHGALSRHVHFVLDEFAAMPLPGFTRELATMRSRNISASTIIQNMAQIKELYKDSWETIPGNSDTILYLGGNEASTHKYISEALGKATIDTRTHGQTKGRSGSYSTNFQMSGRELLTPDEVRGLDNRYAILFIRGARPVMDLKYELTQHPAIRHTVDGGGPPYIHKGKQAPAFTGTPLFQAFSAEELNESEENAA
ncbi:VirD4-like conjugal transfer protein, CD1115 family [Flavonifractor plautii]|uniref:VirD4-like conjugal transfer protein, CD1115 family n=1 Tax=Flavonifractor plautii TaxID=292800 RepID=UPI003A2F9F80